ncbi:unnamed protein product, partial [Rotaria sp. Silwood2]
FYLSQRTLRNAVRNPALALSQTLASIIIGLLAGLLFYELKKTTEPGVQNRLGAIFFIVISQIFSNLTALEPLIKERVLFIRVIFSYTKMKKLYLMSFRNIQVVITESSRFLLAN